MTSRDHSSGLLKSICAVAVVRWSCSRKVICELQLVSAVSLQIAVDFLCQRKTTRQGDVYPHTWLSSGVWQVVVCIRICP